MNHLTLEELKKINECENFCGDPQCGHRESVHNMLVELCTAPNCRCVGFLQKEKSQ